MLKYPLSYRTVTEVYSMFRDFMNGSLMILSPSIKYEGMENTKCL